MSVAVSARARMYFVLKMLRPLFSIAPALKSRHGDDHEALEVELEAEDVLVPLHALLERLHREAGLVELAGLDVDLQQRAACPSAW